jgi:6-phosphogluconolactonase (cycloisomerase 2 family)
MLSLIALILVIGLFGCGSSSTNTLSSSDTMYVAAKASHGVWGYYADFNIGSLIKIGGSPFATQLNPTAIVINAAHTFAYVSNAASNTINGYTFDLNGSMVANGTVTTGPSPVALAIDSSGKFLFVANQGTAAPGFTPGYLSVFAIGASGTLTPVQAQVQLPNLQCPTPQALSCPAPVALAITPSASFLYVTDQSQNLLFTFSVDPVTGKLTPGSTLPAVSTDLAPSALAMNAAGTLLYVVNRDSESVSGFTISADNSANPGALTAIGGSFPTELSPVAAAVDPSGTYLYVADKTSNAVTGFRIKAVIGTLTALSNSPYSTGSAPDALAISPTNKFLYVSNSGSASLSAFKIDPTTGNLIPASGPVPTGIAPAGIAFGR